MRRCALLGAGHLQIADYLAINSRARQAARAMLEARAIDAGRYIEPDAPLEIWARSLAIELPLVRPLDGAAGVFLLTAPESGSYTPALR